MRLGGTLWSSSRVELVDAAHHLAGERAEGEARVVARLELDALERRLGDVLVLVAAGDREDLEDLLDVVVDPVPEDAELGAELVVGAEQALLPDVDAAFEAVGDLGLEIGVGDEAAGRDRRRVEAVDQRLGDRRRAVALGIGGVERDRVERRDADGELRREPRALVDDAAAGEPVAVVAERADQLQPLGDLGAVLDIGAVDDALARGGQVVAGAGRVAGLDLVVEDVDAVGDGMGDPPGLEARGVEQIEADGADLVGLARVPVLVGEARGRVVGLGGEVGPGVVRRVAVAEGVGVGDGVARRGVDQRVVEARIVVEGGERHVVGVGRPEARLGEAGDKVLRRVDGLAAAGLVVAGIAPGRGADHVDAVAQPRRRLAVDHRRGGVGLKGGLEADRRRSRPSSSTSSASSVVKLTTPPIAPEP